MKKIKFLNFLRQDGVSLNKIKFYAGDLLSGPMEEVELEAEISDGRISFNILKSGYYDQQELEWIERDLRKISWNGFEFITLFDLNGKDKYRLIADTTSEMFDIVGSQQNLQTLQNMEKSLKKFIK